MKKIAAVCAFPSGLNPGMLSVDMAIDSLAREWGDDTGLIRFCVEAGFDIESASGVTKYNHLTTVEQLEGFDHVIFWGDFLHWVGYAKRDLLTRQKKRRPDRSDTEIIDEWYRLMMLEHREDLQKKTIVFGSTLYGLNSGVFGDERYSKALASLYRNAALVQMRDILSANFISQLAQRDQPAFGCDCALLLDTSGWALPEVDQSGYVLCSFGRSGASWALQGFTTMVAKAAGLKLVNLNWLDATGFAGLRKKIAWIRCADFVITDTYHLAVTALREGVPTVGIGRGSSAADSTLSDKKKELFFQQAFIADRYLFVEQIRDSLESETSAARLARAVIERARDQNVFRSATALLKGQAQRSAQRLAGVIVTRGSRG